MSSRKRTPKNTARVRRSGERATPAAAFRTIRFSRRDAIATVTLDRPDVLNAYNVEMRDELYAAFSAVADDPSIRVLVLRGAGPAFCSGGDLSEFGAAPSPLMARWVRWRRDVWGLLASLDAITVAAVHGHVAGSGLEMALLCDIVLAADDVVMLLPECGLGLIPGVGGTQTLPRAVGIGRALDLILTGRRVDAQEAVRIALANRTVPRDDLDRAAQELADHVATLRGTVVAAVKHCVARGVDLPLIEGLAMERRVAVRIERDEPGSFRRRTP